MELVRSPQCRGDFSPPAFILYITGFQILFFSFIIFCCVLCYFYTVFFISCHAACLICHCSTWSERVCFNTCIAIVIQQFILQMARTQKNKATSGHLGLLKARLAKLRRELIEPKGVGGGSGEGFDVAKTGDARIGFVGL